MIMNNFQRLYEEEELRFAEADNQEVLNSIQDTLRFFRMIGDVADIYLNNMVGVLVDTIDYAPNTEDRMRGAYGASPSDAPAVNGTPQDPGEPPE